MEAIQWAFIKALARVWLHRLPSVVTGLAEMVSTEAEPSGSFAAVAAFVNDVVSTMFSAVLHANLYTILLA